MVDDTSRSRREYLAGAGLVFGAGIGGALGVIWGDIALYAAIGAGLGLVFGAAIGSMQP